jgi:hypothetical protein
MRDVVAVQRLRWQARTPRIMFVATCAVLSCAGIASILGSGARGSVPGTAHPHQVDIAVLGFAEAFARTYLTASSSHGEQRDHELAAFMLPDDGLPADSVPPQRVRWTSIAGWQPQGDGARVTVLADTGHRRWYLAVTVARDAGGRLHVAGPPAVVGPPATVTRSPSAPEMEVEDPGLRTVAARVVRHYLAGETTDLAADLAAGAAISTPPTALLVVDVFATTWARRPSRVAVVVVARDVSGMQLTLRYELAVVRSGGRWLVRSVHVNPMYREVLP